MNNKKIIKNNNYIIIISTEGSIKVVQPRKIRSQAKIHNFSFKNSNIVIEGIIQKRKYYFL